MANGEAFSRVKIDAQLRDVGWRIDDGRSVRFEYTLSDGTRADYMLADRHGRPLAVIEAKIGEEIEALMDRLRETAAA